MITFYCTQYPVTIYNHDPFYCLDVIVYKSWVVPYSNGWLEISIYHVISIVSESAVYINNDHNIDYNRIQGPGLKMHGVTIFQKFPFIFQGHIILHYALTLKQALLKNVVIAKHNAMRCIAGHIQPVCL